jgi:hypothetical protein
MGIGSVSNWALTKGISAERRVSEKRIALINIINFLIIDAYSPTSTLLPTENGWKLEFNKDLTAIPWW